MDVNVRVAGEAGQGVQTTGNLLLGAFAGLGLHVLSCQSYMSRIRGGLNWFDCRVADGERFSPLRRADLLVALTRPALEVLGGDLNSGGMALFAGGEAPGAVAIDFARAARDVAGSDIMGNTVAAGAVFRVLGYDCDRLCDHLRQQFSSKGDDVVEGNVRCARRGAELAADHAGGVPAPTPGEAPARLYSGAEAVALGAATAGAKLVAAYPMTPATATFAALAGLADRYGIVVEQAEDELAAVNMVCGAVYAGAPGIAATSGGGFALMTEGLSLAGIMELPIVILLAQRPGPATGLPTRTAQQDLRFALSAGHGEFARAVFAPGTLRQCYDLTRRAFQTAHEYQTPVIILTDQFLQDLRKNVPPLDETLRPIDRHVVPASGDYRRYQVTQSGVSPRAVPGGEGLVICDSDEHDDRGNITEDLETHVEQQDKRLRKLTGLSARAMPPERYGPDDAATVLVAWGSTYGPCREAVDRLNADGARSAMVYFAQVWPVPLPGARRALEGAERVIVVEGNATGQMGSVLREAGLCGQTEPLLRCDGLPFTAEYIASRVRE